MISEYVRGAATGVVKRVVVERPFVLLLVRLCANSVLGVGDCLARRRSEFYRCRRALSGQKTRQIMQLTSDVTRRTAVSRESSAAEIPAHRSPENEVRRVIEHPVGLMPTMILPLAATA